MRKVSKAQELYSDINYKTAFGIANGGSYGMPWVPEALHSQTFNTGLGHNEDVPGSEHGSHGGHYKPRNDPHNDPHQLNHKAQKVLGNSINDFDDPTHHLTVAQNHIDIAVDHSGYAAMSEPGSEEFDKHIAASQAHSDAADAWKASHDAAKGRTGMDGFTDKTGDAYDASLAAYNATVNATPESERLTTPKPGCPDCPQQPAIGQSSVVPAIPQSSTGVATT